MQALALRAGSGWRVPGWRLAVAVLIFGSTLAGAAILHGIHASPPVCPRGFICAWGTGPDRYARVYPRPGWGDPIALAVCLLGFAGTAAVLLSRRRREVAALVLGAALAAATILNFQNQLVSQDCPRYPQSAYHLSPCIGPLQATWFGGLVHFNEAYSPHFFRWIALAVVLLGVAGAAVVLATARGPLANAALILGAALICAAILQVVGYPSGFVACDFFTRPGGHPGRPDCVQVPGRRWVDPASLAVCVLGLTGATGVLLTARRSKTR